MFARCRDFLDDNWPCGDYSDGDNFVIAIFTATNVRNDILQVWCDALRVTLRDSYATHVYHITPEPPACGDSASRIPDWNIGTPLGCVLNEMPRTGQRMFLEEDIIPVREWSLDDYPGQWAIMEFAPNQFWHSVVIARGDSENIGPIDQTTRLPQRFVRQHGCPDWLPADLCEPAIRANSSVVGDHFLHLDKMTRGAPEMAEKNALLAILAEMFRYAERPADFEPLVPFVPETVSAASSGHGPGTELSRLLKRFGIEPTPTCQCRAKAREMDAWGPDECEKPERIEEVLGVMREEAKARGLPFLDAAGRMLIRRAIANARRASS